MRRAIGILLALAAVVAIVLLIGSGDGDSGYKVRAIFDNADFVVNGEEVRVAGATVGTVESVDLSMPGEQTNADGSDTTGKAVVVMDITDPGFQDFRTDASCLIRPQSLIGEKFVECEPTQPRAPGSAPPPELSEVPPGQAGAGQHLLPVERNGKAIDLDLVQNVLRRPYADRFRLILNELGVGLAARGQDLAAIVDRANPALRETDKVLAILAQQNEDLAQLAENSDTTLAPLARERAHITGFFRNANVTNNAVLERRPEFEEGLQKLPAALKDVRRTMAALNDLTDQGTPLFTSLDNVGPGLSKATKKLGPFATSAIPALTTLGDAAQTAGPKIVAADPVTVQTRDLGNAATPVNQNLGALLQNFDQTNGFKYLMDFIYNSAGSVNGYDQYGHSLRANLQLTSCLDYQPIVYSGCEAFFFPEDTSGSKCQQKNKKKRKKCKQKQKKKKKKIAAPGLARAPGSGAAALDATGGTTGAAQAAQLTVQQGAQALDFLFGDGADDSGAKAPEGSGSAGGTTP